MRNQKEYILDDLILAMQYQKAECYQIVGNLLIRDNPDIESALNYLANDKTASIDEVLDLLKK